MKFLRGGAAVLLGVLVLALLPISAEAATACPKDRCRDIRVPVPAGLKVPNRTVRVLLPADHKKGHRYPVLYLLHGVGDTYKTWTENTDLTSFSKKYKVIVVMPDGGKGSDAGWYSDWKDGSRHWETFHTRVLVGYIDKTFRTMGSGHRAIAGVSMGGFGAMKYAARHRALFRAAASFSGWVDTMYGYPLSGPFYHYAGQGFQGQSLGTPNENVWGDQFGDEQRWRAHNPTDIAAKLKGVSLYISSAMGTPGGPAGDDASRPHSYLNENFIWQVNRSFVGALDDAKVRYTSDFHGGYHHWPYWQRDLHNALPRLYKTIR